MLLYAAFFYFYTLISHLYIMRYLLFVFLLTSYFSYSQIVEIPDANFKNALINTNCVDTDGFGGFDADADTNDDGEIQVNEAEAVLRLNVSNQNIQSLQGILSFMNLETLYFNDNNVNESLDFTSLSNLVELEAVSNQIPSINVSNLTNLEYLQLEANSLTSIDFSGCISLANLGLGFNQLTGNIDLNGFANLSSVLLFNNQITSVSTSGLSSLNGFVCRNNNITSLDLTDSPNLNSIDCENNQITSLNLTGLTSITSITCNGNELTSLDIASSIPTLDALFCYDNQLTSLNVTGYPSLVVLECYSNELSTLNINGLQNLQDVKCTSNQITELETNNLPALVTLWCSANQIQALSFDVSESLEDLSCSDNVLTQLNISNSNNLNELNVSDNQLTNIDLSNNTLISELDCENNQLISLDVSALSNLNILNCMNNQLESLFLKNGSLESYLDFGDNPNLSYVCADEDQFNDVEALINGYNYTNCVLNSYCSFVPGGSYYSLTGESRTDFDANGCDNADALYPYVKINVSNLEANAIFISNELGSYSIPLQVGTHTVEPVLEDLDYYTITPSISNIDIIDDDVALDFCIVSDGINNDLEVVLVPLEAARPGFDTNYKIVYKNKGNTILNGTIDLEFQDNYMDFLLANPTEVNMSFGNLQWNYSNLLPIETREIELSFTLNTPTDSNFPLNGNDILSFNASIDPINNDETPEDNVFTLEQIVVNSYDPNDIRCLEGETISPDKVGDYVHYLIRFENLGTANAVNVVVKDVIDETKFDVSTLIPLNASHSFTTRIREGNIVEFIFENIQLPFDDANNDGYIIFKIKTLDTLVLGDTFENEAEIYFDFNFPVVTNNYSTEVTEDSLSINDFKTNNINIYPNPVTDVITIQSQLEIDKIEIADVNGRTVYNKLLGQPILEHSIQIGSISQGLYFITIEFESGVEVAKFIKK